MAGSRRPTGRKTSTGKRVAPLRCPVFSPLSFTKIFVNIANVFHDEAFREEEGVVICQMRLLIRIGETCQINLNGAEL